MERGISHNIKLLFTYIFDVKSHIEAIVRRGAGSGELPQRQEGLQDVLRVSGRRAAPQDVSDGLGLQRERGRLRLAQRCRRVRPSRRSVK